MKTILIKNPELNNEKYKINLDYEMNDIKEGYSKEWVMADILHCGSKEIFNEITRG